MKPLGNTPEPLIRDFRIFNKSSHARYAHVDLLCLKNRTADDLNGGSVQNTASVYSDQPDWSFANNFDSYVLEDPPLTDDGGDPGPLFGGDAGTDSDAGDAGADGESGDAGGSETEGGRDESRLENCLERAKRFDSKKRRHKAAKKCRRLYG